MKKNKDKITPFEKAGQKDADCSSLSLHRLVVAIHNERKKLIPSFIEMLKERAERINNVDKSITVPSTILENNQIFFTDIVDSGFNIQDVEDDVYMKQNGYKYTINTLYLTTEIYLNWDKETKLCQMVRVDNKNTQNVVAKMPIKGLNHLKEIIAFFK